MADKPRLVGVGPLTHTLHVWPIDEVVAHSAYWPAWWYPAYERAVRQLADGVACCVLGGLPNCPEPIRMELQPSGNLTFRVHLQGTTIEVFIWQFEGPEDPGPDAPGPNGGARQHAAEGLVLGLRGTGKEFSVARFYDGLVPSVPVGSGVRIRPSTVGITSAASWVAVRPRMAPANTTRASDRNRGASVFPVWSAKQAATMYSAVLSSRKTPAIVQSGLKAERHRSVWTGATRRQAPEPAGFDGLDFERLISERPQPMNGAPISDLRSCLEMPHFEEASGRQLH